MVGLAGGNSLALKNDPKGCSGSGNRLRNSVAINNCGGARVGGGSLSIASHEAVMVVSVWWSEDGWQLADSGLKWGRC